jgi:NAD(P)H-quinone oxidoreductase subunit 5
MPAGFKVSFGIRIDILSSLLFFMIATLGASIGQYSLRYLHGEKNQGYFYKYLLGIILSSSLLVISSNLLMFFVMWLAISYNLHKLLIYFSDRPNALVAARKKAIISRLGDIILLAAIILTYSVFGSFDFTDIFTAMKTIPSNSESQKMISFISILIAIGALIKSAQFPLHFWLPETMETPTPVSAIMHAGVINAGGFLVIRMSPIFEHATASLFIIAIVGTISAVFGALCMIVQNDIKKKLAYSTISQMGIMMLACGLGAYGIALFHIFAHSFYKSYAFLSTGKLVEESKKIRLNIKPSSNWIVLLGTVVGIVSVAGGTLFANGDFLAPVTYGGILTLGFLQGLNLSQKSTNSILIIFAKIMGSMILAIIVYAAIGQILNLYLLELVPKVFNSESGRYTLTAISAIVFSLFLASFVLSVRLMNINTPFLEWAYLYFKNGGYMSSMSTMVLARTNTLPQILK